MAEAIVTPRYLNEPKPGMKNASITTTEGARYYMPPEMLGQFRQGVEVVIVYNPGEFNGKPFNKISSVKPLERAQSHPQAQAQSASHQQQSGGGKWGSTDAITAERIFVCGALNHAIQGGEIRVTDVAGVVHAINSLRTAWDQTFGSPQDQMGGDMNDRIPF